MSEVGLTYYTLIKDKKPVQVSKEKAREHLFRFKRTKSITTWKGYEVLMGFHHYAPTEAPLPHKLFFISVTHPDFPDMRLLKFETYEEADNEYQRLCEELVQKRA